ncbi:MAG TPA: hypothetical protein VEY91_13215, partial [Candidatus Limnocylindria bacterium]|nr:hypothetical protein [Candidatus Limnocylindria bacterium]
PDALLGIAQAWDLGDRPERAYEILTELLAGEPGEVGPAALERYAALAERLGRPETSRKARERLLQAYPRSIEAAAARLALASLPSEPGAGAVGVAIGTFIDRGRARLLASEAKRAGFPDAQVVSRGQGLTAVHTVRLGIYSRRVDAIQAGEQAAKALGVTYQVVKAP